MANDLPDTVYGQQCCGCTRRGPEGDAAFHEGKLFTLGISGIVAAFEAVSGKLVWRTAAPSEHPYFNAASSLLGATGVVIAHLGNYGPLTAFEASTGDVKWMAATAVFSRHLSSPPSRELAR